MEQLLPVVPVMVMQGQPIKITWTGVGADLYIVERSVDSGEWLQIYGGVALEYEDTAGEWSTVQYRVTPVTGGVSGEAETTGPVAVVPTAAVYITGEDGDLGALTQDHTYRVLTNTGKKIAVTQTINKHQVQVFELDSGAEITIPVLDLTSGSGTIVISAKVVTDDEDNTVERKWSYTKTAQGFSNTGGAGELKESGKPFWPATLAEMVRTRGGKPLDRIVDSLLWDETAAALGLIWEKVEQKALGGGTEGDLVVLNEGGKATTFYLAKHDYEAGLNGAGRELLVREFSNKSGAWSSTGANAYATNNQDAWFNGEYKALHTVDVQEAMGETTFYYTPGNGDTTVTTLARSVFALSITEFGQSNGDYSNVEGTVLPIADTLKILYSENGTATNQWTRSPYIGNTTNAYRIGSTGVAGAVGQTNNMPYRPAFTLPADFAPPVYWKNTLTGEITFDDPGEAIPAKAMDVLARLSYGLLNDYIWKTEKYEYGYTLTPVTASGSIVFSELPESNHLGTATIRYSSEIEVNTDGKVVLKNYSTVKTSYDPDIMENFQATIRGKYIRSPEDNDTIYLVSNELVVQRQWSNSDNVYRTYAARNYMTLVVGYKNATGEAEYINNANDFAYPPEEDDGRTYVPLGRLGDHVIATGSYTGTGTYGANSPNTIYTPFPAKMVIVYHDSLVATAGSMPMTFLFPSYYCLSINVGSDSSAAVLQVPNIVGYSEVNKMYRWYNTKSAANQCNQSGKVYKWLAFN